MKKNFKWLFVAALAIGTAAMVACGKDDDKEPEPGPTVADPDNIAKENLIAYWAFNDSPNDTKGNRTGTEEGNVTYVAGKRGKAYQGAEASYITFPYSATDKIANVKQYTIALWVKFVARAGADAIFSLSGGEVVMVDGVASIPADHWAAGMQIYQDGKADSVTLLTRGNRNEFGILWSPEGAAAKTPMAADSGWYHFMVKYDNATSTKCYYINGKKYARSELANIPQVEGATPAVPLGDLHQYTRVGKPNIGVIGYWANQVLQYDMLAWQNTFRGQLDEMRIYNRALTDKEIQDLYDAEVAVAD